MLASPIGVKASAGSKRSIAAVRPPSRATLESAQHLIAEAGAPAFRVGAAWDATGDELPRRRLAKIPVFSAGEREFAARPAIRTPGILIQAKLRVGQADDPLEHEADRVAAEVMRAPAPHTFIGQAPPQISRKADLSSPSAPQGRRSNSGGAEPGIVHQVLHGPGQPMDAETRAFMEPRFRRDFGQIRIHTDTSAAQSAKELNARAYTAGNNIVFAQGEFAPRSAGGRILLAHELVHTLQQGGQPQLIQRSPDKDDAPAPQIPHDATVTQKAEGNKIIHRERLDRGREHSLLVKTIDVGVFPPSVQQHLYRGQELPSLRGNKTEISWVDVTQEAQRDGSLSVDWNMPDIDADDPAKQRAKDREIAEQHPNPILSLLVPASNAFVKDRSSEIHNPLKRSQYQIGRQAIEAGTNLGRVTGAVLADTAAAASFAPAAAEGASFFAPEALYAARYVYLNAPSLYASAVLYGGAITTGAALAAHIQKIKQDGFDPSDIPQLAEDLMPAANGYLEATYFAGPSPSRTPGGGSTAPGAPSGEPVESDFVITRPAAYDRQTGRFSGSMVQRSTGQTFDAEMDSAGNGQIINRVTRQVVGIIDGGEMRSPAAGALPAAGRSSAATPTPAPSPVAAPRAQTAPPSAPTVGTLPPAAARPLLGAAPDPVPTRPPAPAVTPGGTNPAASGGAPPSAAPPRQPVRRVVPSPAPKPQQAADPQTKPMKKPAHGGPRTAVHATAKTVTSAKPGNPETTHLPRSSRPYTPEYAADPNVPVKADVRDNFTFDQYQRNGKTYKWGRGILGKAGEVVKHDDPAAKRSVSRGTGDDAGHLIARMYGGPSGAENLSRQNWIQNEYGTFRNLEQYWESQQNKGFEIEVQVTDVTKAGADRPFLRNVQWTETAPDGTKVDHSLDFVNTTTTESRQAAGSQPTPSGSGGKVLPGPGSSR